MTTCPQCGARYSDAGDDCARRFESLLALDHSRREPWGSRHGTAYAVYTLQHPQGVTGEALERAWAMLTRLYVSGDDPAAVVRGLRRAGARTPLGWTVTAFPGIEGRRRPFARTIADLGAFDAATYATQLDAWCEETLASYGIDDEG